MKRLTLLTAMLLLTAGAMAQRSFELKNSDDGKSVLYCFLPSPDKSTGRAVVCCPGGGYQHVCMDYEGTDWAPYFNDQGIAYFVLRYRMPKGDRNIPMDDAKHAITTVRDSASVWHINPYDVGIMGFSAGGHLASTIATHTDFDARPNFQILFYPVISMDQKITHKGSCVNFLGEGQKDPELVKEYSNDKQIVTHLTPPAILFMADDDGTVPVLTNGIAYYTSLRRNCVNAALHVYPYGGHGWRPKEFPFYDDMLQSLTKWLSKLPSHKQDAIRVACIGNSITYGSGIDKRDKQGYPAQLQNMLGSGYHVRNFGLGARTMLSTGDHPYMNEYMWKDCKDFNPNIAIIKLGTNDSKTANWNAAQYEKDMQQMIDELKALPSHPRILLGYPAKAWKEQWTIREEVITGEIIPIIDRVAKKNKLEVIDFHTPTSTSSDLFVSDMIHPNAKGAKVMAETAKTAILGL